MSPRPGRGTAASACRSRASRLRCRGRSRKSGSSTTNIVHQGDVLYVIDPFDFQVALDTSQGAIASEKPPICRSSGCRRSGGSTSPISPRHRRSSSYSSATPSRRRPTFDAAQQQVAQADINLKRTQVRSPVNGYVTNLLLRVGDYANAGTTNISVIDADSYWIDGYFEETKMAHVCIGDRAEAALMGYRDPIVGRVETVTRGISVSNAAPSTQGLPSVDPVYTWVRLAQRVPVRIRITNVPAGVPLVSGMTATVTIRRDEAPESTAWLALSSRPACDTPGRHRLRSTAVTRLRAEDRRRERSDRDPSYTQTCRSPRSRTAHPGLAPGIDKSPRVQMPAHPDHAISK